MIVTTVQRNESVQKDVDRSDNLEKIAAPALKPVVRDSAYWSDPFPSGWLAKHAPGPVSERLTFARFEDIEEDSNRGLQLNLVEAYLDGKAVGELRFEYLPRERFTQHFSAGVLAYDFAYRGNNDLFGQSPSVRVKRSQYDVLNFSDDKLRVLVRNIFKHVMPGHLAKGRIVAMDRPALLDIVAEAEQVVQRQTYGWCNRTKGEVFSDFQSFWLDKPAVDWVRVHDFMQRRGVGTALYIEAAAWMMEKGMRLYASGTQSKGATQAWKRFVKNGWVRADGKRRYLAHATVALAPCV